MATKTADTNPVTNLEAPVILIMQYERPPHGLEEFPATNEVFVGQVRHPVAPEVVQFNVNPVSEEIE